MENVPKNFLPLLGIRQQQLQEITLGNHGNLGKLIPVKAKNLFDGCIHILQLGHHMAIRINKAGICCLLRHALAAALGAHIFGISGNCIFFSCIAEGQFYFCRGLVICIFGAQHSRLPVAAAGFSEQGKADSIENGGLSGTGIAGNQIQAAGTQVLKVKLHLTRIGAEGRYGQFQRSHFPPSQMDSISSRINSCWTSFMGCPF